MFLIFLYTKKSLKNRDINCPSIESIKIKLGYYLQLETREKLVYEILEVVP